MTDSQENAFRQLDRTDVVLVLDDDGTPTFELPNGEQLRIRPRLYVDGELRQVSIRQDSPYGDVGVWEVVADEGERSVRIELTPEFHEGES